MKLSTKDSGAITPRMLKLKLFFGLCFLLGAQSVSANSINSSLVATCDGFSISGAGDLGSSFTGNIPWVVGSCEDPIGAIPGVNGTPFSGSIPIANNTGMTTSVPFGPVSHSWGSPMPSGSFQVCASADLVGDAPSSCSTSGGCKVDMGPVLVQDCSGGPAIDIEKLTNGVDADDPTAGDAPLIAPDGTVNWTYQVTNTGNVTVFDVEVTDDREPDVFCGNDPIILAPGESINCTLSGVALHLDSPLTTTIPGTCGNTPNQPMYENFGSVTALASQAGGEEDIEVTDTDPSHYCNALAQPAISIEKATNGIDADDAGAGDAPEIAPGGAVNWTYVVTNIGDVPLINVDVVDDQDVSVSCPKSTLAVDESMLCTASGVAENLGNTSHTTVGGVCLNGRPDTLLYKNIGTVVANTVPSGGGDQVTDTDPSHYCNPEVPMICGLTVQKGCEIEVPPPSTVVEKCDGRLQQLTMIWSGPGPISIAGPNNDAPGGVVNTGEEVTLFGPFDDNDVVVQVSGQLDGVSVFHTSCSDKDMNGDNENEDQSQVSPIGRDCGKFQGNGKKGDSGNINDWLLEGFVDNAGDVLDCTIEPIGGPLVSECAFQSEPVSCETHGKPETITMRYVGGSCPGNNTQGSKTNCSESGDLGGNDVTVTLDGGSIGPISLGDTFVVPATGSSTDIILSNSGGMQSHAVHTSCSAPLVSSATFGAMQLVALDNEGEGANVIYTYLIGNDGTEAVSNIAAFDDQIGDVSLPTGTLLPGETMEATATAFVSETITNTVSVTGEFSGTPFGAQCDATDTATVTAVEPPPCDISGAGVFEEYEHGKLKWELENTGAQTATIASITVVWTEASEHVKEIKLDGDKFFDTDTDWVAGGVTFGPADWTGNTDRRQIDSGDTETLEIKFDEHAHGSIADEYSIMVEFEEGCSVAINP